MTLKCKTYRAFTLWEVIIALIITSTIVSLSYGSYRVMTDLLHLDEDSLNEVHQILSLERDLWRMVESCQSMELFGNEIVFEGFSDECFLQFMDSTLLLCSTGEVVESEIRVLDWKVEYLDERLDFLRSFEVQCSMGKEVYGLSFVKHYPSLFKLKLNL